jgi:hypothetical protein
MRPSPFRRRISAVLHPTDRQEAALIQAGDTLYTPVTKERMTFLKTAADTNGEYVLIELSAAPGRGRGRGSRPPEPDRDVRDPPRHPRRRKGRRGSSSRRRPATSSWSSPASRTSGGTPARTSSCPSAARCARRFQFERMIETMFGLAGRRQDEQEGHAQPRCGSRSSRTTLRRRASPRRPRWMQKAALAMGAPMGPQPRLPAPLRAGGRARAGDHLRRRRHQCRSGST